ncbi:carboxylesterase [Gemella sp. ND 6198]|uniref:carboxylesterase family protein n=1 Tax=Gemella sp. ND 6198 TaxID=2040624 RepID=UPI000E0C04A9|nr:carboxylesterase family protein [Gemella sp. ND 6198]AXI26815.1 carboxylesterase [Gemella sp. ND 6198]
MILQTKIGKVYTDIVGKDFQGNDVHSILSVPYARAERFEYPELISREEYSEDSFLNREGSFCFPQKKYPLKLNIFMKHHMLRPEFQPLKDVQTENAFVVNIWASDKFTEKKPVVVFLHGGGEGSGTVPIYMMNHIAEQGVVAVTITYRIGNFGYMPIFDNGEIRGSLAYLDQQTALTWIQNNISSFGGDNTNITLMGHCGGAVAALYHYLNSTSNKLFHKLILCAGNIPILSKIDFAKNQYKKLLAKNHLTGLKELKKLSVKDLLKIKGGQNDIIDGKFFTEHPMNLLKRGEFPSMPVLIGANKDEFSMIELPMYYKTLGITKKKEQLKEILLKKYGEFAEILKNEFKTEATGVVDLQVLIMELFVFHSSTLFLMETLEKKCPIYGYRMNYVPNLYNGLRGSCHGAELAFFFGTIDKMNIQITDENRRAVMSIQKDWTEFIKSGKIADRPLFNETDKIIQYDKDIKAVPFPHVDLIHRTQNSGIADKLRKEYISNRR